ncbi:putative histone deacetylase complex subunit cti6 [Aspergillus udagawae]|uniref:Histone deacetylase complex subunit cti6 n=1 Tax=Aspergillus udagawae TaxID=91492 RepID=A0A8H3SGY9_9EURO|nr:putative histone deacetylase complex subunit cti6 [Aspergillus udagawae]GFF59452.1 putative histone deacetylase complex subunit cti6 [Aspergillus udagawae]GFF59804.1 putative histone deacetylase complex subunit cti6 [Aspergillus udagawae]GFF95787.1 putative histone deacetylase complex subunit cti6 [Aspergillus udagawae]GFG17306.1 putative histone deacetylase complex subunit cti6 [Aspergillus udagawae]
MTPRRSSRARTSQPSPAILQHTNSSSSSNSLTRERSTRSNHKISSPQRSLTQRSQSIDDADSATRNDYPQTRQRQRSRGDDDNLRLNGEEDDEDEDGEGDEEEEVTRCLCGQQDYPGLPPSRREALGRNGVAVGFKDQHALNLSADSSDLMSDDIGSMFIQCDSCKVWQHGGCVGIMDEAMSPDEYFCEECRKDLHRIKNESNGQYSSQYLPVAPIQPSPATSRDSSRDNSRRAKDSKSRQNESIANPKRRSTMNSRDAAYDEEEQLRRAIEESKEDTQPPAEDIALRRGKRSRSDSEAHKQVTKRQRTSSPSPSAVSKPENAESQPASEDESKTNVNGNGTKNSRVAPRGHREKPIKEPEEPETDPAEIASRKKGKLERRNGEDADREMASPTKATVEDHEPPQTSPETAAPAPEPAPSRPSTRKSGRPPARRGGRVGRNQYTRDRDINGADSPRRGQSHDIGGDSPRVGTVNGAHYNVDSGKPSRPRYMNPQRTTMNEMKRRVAGILEFISRMQVEMAVAGETSTPSGNGDQPNGSLTKATMDQIETALLSNTNEVESGTSSIDSETGSGQASKEKEFKDLSSVEMMDVLTRHLLKWQQEYGKFGER